jgi:histidine ammonia-lyase
VSEHSTTVFGQQRLSIEDIVHIALEQGAVALTSDRQFANKIDSAVAFLDKLLEDDGVIYGVTTGYGDSVTVKVPLDLVNELPLHLTRFHGCGLGDVFNQAQGRAILSLQRLLTIWTSASTHTLIQIIPQNIWDVHTFTIESKTKC